MLHHGARQDRTLPERLHAGLPRNYQWWWDNRQLADTGLLAYGTSLDAGDGRYKGTKLAAKDESTMDNSPLHDPVAFAAATGLLLAADVGLNSIAAINGEVLALLATELRLAEAAAAMDRRVAAHQRRIADWLWDAERGIFANRMVDGTSVPPVGSCFVCRGTGDDWWIERADDGAILMGTIARGVPLTSSWPVRHPPPPCLASQAEQCGYPSWPMAATTQPHNLIRQAALRMQHCLTVAWDLKATSSKQPTAVQCGH